MALSDRYASQYKKWKEDKSIPLVQVVQSFDIFEIESGGNEGLLRRPSKQVLESTFNTKRNDDVIMQILTEGKLHHTHSHGSDGNLVYNHSLMINNRSTGV